MKKLRCREAWGHIHGYIATNFYLLEGGRRYSNSRGVDRQGEREIGGSGIEKLHSYQERGRDKRYKQYYFFWSPLRSILHVYVPTTVSHLCFIRHFCILLSSSFCWLIWLSKL